MKSDMFKLLKNGICYDPEFVGKKDILMVKDTIYRVEEHIDEKAFSDVEVIDCSDKIICPGFIDQHVHIIGGGGEEGPGSRIPEIMLSEIVSAGITTVVGILGFDSITRSPRGLLAKARALEEEGLNTFIYTGSYEVPTPTITESVISDISLIDKIIGVGEIAISDHRSSHPSTDSLKKIANGARIGGLVGKKAGVVHIHVGDGKGGLDPLIELIENSDFPLEMFIPTHLNRNKTLFYQALEYAKGGGNIDFTAGQNDGTGISVPEALNLCIDLGLGLERVTVSSDANGSIPGSKEGESGVGKAVQLYEDIKNSILMSKLDMAEVLKTVTANVAKILKIYPAKGTLKKGSDADVLVLSKDGLEIDKVFIMGEQFIEKGTVLKRGRYEDLHEVIK